MKRCFWFFSVPFFFKLRGSRCAELFQGKKLQKFVGKNIAKRQKYLFVGRACKLSLGQNTSLLFLQSCAKKTNGTGTLGPRFLKK